MPLDQVVVKLDDGKPRVRIGEALEVPIAADGTFLVPSRSGLAAAMKGVTRDADGKPKEVEYLTSLTVDELAYTGEANDEVAKRILASFQSRFDSLKENLVVIGFDRTADRRITTETGETLSETSLIARAIATIQSGRHIHWWPSWARWFAVALVVVLAAILFRLPRAKFIPATFVALLAFFAVKVLVFSATLAWTPPFVVMSLFALILVIGLIIPGAPAKSTPKADRAHGSMGRARCPQRAAWCRGAVLLPFAARIRNVGPASRRSMTGGMPVPRGLIPRHSRQPPKSRRLWMRSR